MTPLPSAQSIPPSGPTTKARQVKQATRVNTKQSPKREVSVANQHPRLRLNKPAIKCVIAALDENAKRFRGGCPSGELSIVFMTDDALAQLHADFLDDPTPTDVITFEGTPELGTAGEICVSADRAAAFAAEHDHDFAQELTLYLVHGWLHLAGYDDLRPALKRQMRAAEARAMRCLANATALPDFSLSELGQKALRTS